VRQRQIDAPWKRAEREAFRARLPADRRPRLLEIGAGTGVHGRWFADHDVDVVCTDASGAMVEACRAVGLAAEQIDVLRLGRDASFDAAFAMNCLLHVPRPTLPAALDAVRAALRPGGLFYLGQWGGIDRATTFAEDVYEPKRFFSYLTDDALVEEATAARFDVVEFHTVDVGGEPGTHFQALTLARSE
jgi:SAM-dependent methyltransferase